MKKKQLLHTPEGVRDLYGKEYAAKLNLQDKLMNTIQLYGYENIQTPTFEFFDVFSEEIGTTSSRELYKFFDKEGNTLVLRPDFTPSMKGAGHLGAERVTVQNLEIVKIDVENNLIAIKGAIPGPRKGIVVISDTVKA